MIDADTNLMLHRFWVEELREAEGRVEAAEEKERAAVKRAEEAAGELEAAKEKANQLRRTSGGIQTSLSTLRRGIEELNPRIVEDDADAHAKAEELEGRIRAANRRLEAVRAEASATTARIGALEDRGELAEDAARRRLQAQAYLDGMKRERWMKEYRSYLRGAFEDRLQPEELTRRERLAAGKVSAQHGPEAARWLQDHGMEAVRREHRGAAEPSSANRRPGIKEAVASNAE